MYNSYLEQIREVVNTSQFHESKNVHEFDVLNLSTDCSDYKSTPTNSNRIVCKENFIACKNYFRRKSIVANICNNFIAASEHNVFNTLYTMAAMQQNENVPILSKSTESLPKVTISPIKVKLPLPSTSYSVMNSATILNPYSNEAFSSNYHHYSNFDKFYGNFIGRACVGLSPLKAINVRRCVLALLAITVITIFYYTYYVDTGVFIG